MDEIRRQLIMEILCKIDPPTMDEYKSSVLGLSSSRSPAPSPPERPPIIERLLDAGTRMRSAHELERYRRMLQHQRDLEELQYEGDLERARTMQDAANKREQQHLHAYVESESRNSCADGVLHEVQHLEKSLAKAERILGDNPVILKMVAEHLHQVYGRHGGAYDGF